MWANQSESGKHIESDLDIDHAVTRVRTCLFHAKHGKDGAADLHAIVRLLFFLELSFAQLARDDAHFGAHLDDVFDDLTVEFGMALEGEHMERAQRVWTGGGGF